MVWNTRRIFSFDRHSTFNEYIEIQKKKDVYIYIYIYVKNPGIYLVFSNGIGP